VTLCVLGGLAGLYTIVGGLMAVVLTESLDTIVLLIGSICIAVVGFFAVGGWDGLETAMAEMAEAKQLATTSPGEKDASPIPAKDIPDNVGKHLSIVRGHGDASGLPWYAVLLGYPIIGIWYWCTDQTIVQRVLGAKDENHARVGPLFAGFIKILPVFIFVLPGIICLALIHQGKLGPLPTMVNAEGLTVPDTKATLDTLIRGLLPPGMKGLVAAALLAALMSTVSGALNSIATLFSYDLYKRWRPDTSDRKLVGIGRIVTGCAMVAAIAWSPYVERLGGIFDGINKMIAFIAPPITVLFLWGVFWRKATGRAALTTAWFGTLLGLLMFLLTFFGFFEQWTAHIGFQIPFLLAAVYLFVVCSLVLVLCSYSRRLVLQISAVGTVVGVVAVTAILAGGLDLLATGTIAGSETAKAGPSLVFPAWLPWVVVPAFLYCFSSPLLLLMTLLVPPQPESPERNDLVWKSPLEPLRGEAWRGIGNFRVLTVVLIVTMIAFYWWFA
ncbi:MAG TPA: hypothetical protein DD670_07460, partial [Planctomycetaceae bacterium]|nr:hypothetical protein [Planctomycetaceae bacterium]